jgi:hypothetical protein
MKLSLAISSLLALASAVAVPEVAVRPQIKAYDGFKVFRIAVKNEVAKVSGIVDRLGLETWKAPKAAGALADVVVPPEKLADFRAAVAGLDVTTMHEDLAASIADESRFSIYAGM